MTSIPAERYAAADGLMALVRATPAAGMGHDVRAFMQWQERSGRWDAAGGSGWWRQVNASMMQDMLDAVAALGRPPGTAGSTPTPRGPVQAWIDFVSRAHATAPASAHERTSSRSELQRLYWTAHQLSLHQAIAGAAAVYAAEPPAEQALIASAVQSIDAIALRNWPSDDRLGSGRALALFVGIVLPAVYPSTPLRSRAVQTLQADRFPLSVVFGSPDNVGMSSTRWR